MATPNPAKTVNSCEAGKIPRCHSSLISIEKPKSETPVDRNPKKRPIQLALDQVGPLPGERLGQRQSAVSSRFESDGNIEIIVYAIRSAARLKCRGMQA